MQQLLVCKQCQIIISCSGSLLLSYSHSLEYSRCIKALNLDPLRVIFFSIFSPAVHNLLRLYPAVLLSHPPLTFLLLSLHMLMSGIPTV